MTLLFQPLLEQPNLRGAPHAVRPFQHDQFADEVIQFQTRQSDSVAFFHGATRSCFAWVNLAKTIRRISCCWVSMGRVASINVSPNSGIILSYSSRMRL